MVVPVTKLGLDRVGLIANNIDTDAPDVIASETQGWSFRFCGGNRRDRQGGRAVRNDGSRGVGLVQLSPHAHREQQRRWLIKRRGW
jgi:hypothetical protein